LQPALPTGFDSWAQVFTDLPVSRAFEASPTARCFVSHPELAAPLVAEIGAAIRDKQLHRRPVEAMIRREAVIEPTHDRLGGPDYAALRAAMEGAQESYMRCPRSSASDREVDLDQSLRADVDRFQSAYFAARQRHAVLVAQTRHAAARDYWASIRTRGLDDDFFNDFPDDSVAARISRVEPAWWWRSFFAKLQIECTDHHAADGWFVDAIPTLRAGARKKKLAAAIAEWCETRADDWGWQAPRHYRMLALRAVPKATILASWFERRAPGYLRDQKIRQLLHARLALFLGGLDPMAKIRAAERNGLSAHWRN
jgi:hypothetical protein